MNRLFKVTILLVVSIHFIVSCRLFVKIKVYTDLKCDLPCWNGITPGVSDFAQVKTALQNLAIVNQLDEHNYDRTEPANDVRFGRIFVDDGNVGIQLENDKVVRIDILDESGETVSDLIQQVGPPESVYAHYVGESLDLSILLIYPSRGVYYLVRAQRQSSPYSEWDRLEGNMMILEGVYMVPGSIESMFASMGMTKEYGQCVTKWAQPWNGLGPIRLQPITSYC